MTVTAKNLVPAKVAEATQTTQYTAVNVTTIIDKFTAVDVLSAPPELTTIYIIAGISSPGVMLWHKQMRRKYLNAVMRKPPQAFS